MELKIGEVADGSGVNLQTIRYYERKGLVPEPHRSSSGYRMYSHDTVRRIRFIKRAQELGFSLKEIKELLALQFHSEISSTEVRARVQAKLADVEEKLRALNAIKQALIHLACSCSGEGPVSQCPILKSLDSEEYD